MKRRDMVLGGVAVAGLGGWYLTSGTTVDSTPVNPLVGAANAQSTDDIDISTIQEMSIGNPEAPVTMVEYASYTCPHCASFHAGAFKQLKADYIDTGKINFVYREVYFDRYGLWASMIARCEPTKFFGISDLLYSGQSVWSRAGEPAAIVDELRLIGRKAGLTSDQIEGCLQNADMARNLVAWYEQNAEADQIRSTPSFVINGTKYQNMAYAQMKTILDEAAGA